MEFIDSLLKLISILLWTVGCETDNHLNHNLLDFYAEIYSERVTPKFSLERKTWIWIKSVFWFDGSFDQKILKNWPLSQANDLGSRFHAMMVFFLCFVKIMGFMLFDKDFIRMKGRNNFELGEIIFKHYLRGQWNVCE